MRNPTIGPANYAVDTISFRLRDHTAEGGIKQQYKVDSLTKVSPLFQKYLKYFPAKSNKIMQYNYLFIIDYLQLHKLQSTNAQLSEFFT